MNGRPFRSVSSTVRETMTANQGHNTLPLMAIRFDINQESGMSANQTESSSNAIQIGAQNHSQRR